MNCKLDSVGSVVEFSPYAYEFHEDPYPLYRRLREEAPVYHDPQGEFWALSRHADVLAAFKDVARFSNAHGVSIDPAAKVDFEEWWKRFPDYAVQPEGMRRVHSVNVRGFAVLPIKPGANRVA